MLNSIVTRAAWGIGSTIVGPFVSGTYYIVKKIALSPQVSNFTGDLVSIPFGAMDTIDNTTTILSNFAFNEKMGKNCIKCNLYSGENGYVIAAFENIFSIATAGALSYHFIANAVKTYSIYKEFSDKKLMFKNERGDIEYDTITPLCMASICIVIQGGSAFLCAFSALSANQLPKNKFKIVAFLGVSEVVMKGFEAAMEKENINLEQFATILSQKEQAIDALEEDKRNLEATARSAESRLSAVQVRSSRFEKDVSSAIKAHYFVDEMVEEVRGKANFRSNCVEPKCREMMAFINGKTAQYNTEIGMPQATVPRVINDGKGTTG